MISMGYNATYLNPCMNGSKGYYRINSIQEMKVRALYAYKSEDISLEVTPQQTS